jgi:hypothetical protein
VDRAAALRRRARRPPGPFRLRLHPAPPDAVPAPPASPGDLHRPHHLRLLPRQEQLQDEGSQRSGQLTNGRPTTPTSWRCCCRNTYGSPRCASPSSTTKAGRLNPTATTNTPPPSPRPPPCSPEPGTAPRCPGRPRSSTSTPTAIPSTPTRRCTPRTPECPRCSWRSTASPSPSTN